MPAPAKTTTDHEFRRFDGAAPELTPRQLRKLRGFSRSNPGRQLRIVAVDDAGAAHVSVLASFDDGHVVGPRAVTVRADGQLRWW